MKTNQILQILHVAAWIIFIGLCIQTGSILYSSFVSLFINPEAAKNLYDGLNLSAVLQYSQLYYVYLLSFVIAIGIIKSLIFYYAIKIASKANLENPFNIEITNLLTTISQLAFTVGILAIMTKSFGKWLLQHTAASHNVYEYVGNGGEFLLIAAILFLVAQVMRKGVDLQQENSLTI
jgi:hypothetical protein